MINALTIDVEDYYMVSAFANCVKLSDWNAYESRVERNTRRILDVLDARGVKATFFVLGWVAERHPGLIKDIHAGGHEIASHGYNHRLVYELTPEEFRLDLKRSLDILENLTRADVLGYRAASYSIVPQSIWALDILVEEGFAYDSSIYPIHHDRYGMPGAERHPHLITRANGSLIEVPPPTCKFGTSIFPVAGGGYFRLYPYTLTRYAIRRLNKVEKKPAVVYLHPWEIDPEQPRIQASMLSRFRHYVNLDTTLPKLHTLLDDFTFAPIKTLLERGGHELDNSARRSQRNLHEAYV